ncbi:hypothetical protein [uncultured Pseudoalteromonas sp.]|uniref:hypothetical protein n=1 Tax=uncultured Pseudoalteromonas sp. TaxID=114053 RepID=UPI0030C88E5B
MKNKKENKYILGMSKYFPILLIATCVLIVKSKGGHPLESSGQAGSCVFLIFLFKKPSVFII